jgi:hypothetical protein
MAYPNSNLLVCADFCHVKQLPPVLGRPLRPENPAALTGDGFAKAIKAALDSATIQYVHVDHRGLRVLVTQEFLDSSNVVECGSWSHFADSHSVTKVTSLCDVNGIECWGMAALNNCPSATALKSYYRSAPARLLSITTQSRQTTPQAGFCLRYLPGYFT